MTLIVENGSIVQGADSYISLANARLFLSGVGLSLGLLDITAEVQLRRAFFYIESLRYRGAVVDPTQTTQFPRKNLTRNGVVVPETVVPSEIVRAQAYIAAAIHEGVAIDSAGESVAQKSRVKVGEIETDYYESQVFSTTRVPAAEKLLQVFLINKGAVAFLERA